MQAGLQTLLPGLPLLRQVHYYPLKRLARWSRHGLLPHILPHHFVNRFQIASEAGFIADWRLLQTRSQFSAKLSQADLVSGELGSDLHVGLWIVRDQVGEADVFKRGHAAAGDRGVAAESDDRHTHPQGVETCSVAGVGDRIEADVDLVIP